MRSYTKPAFLAITTHVVSIASMLCRNIIFARLLSPNDFALALTFGVVLSLFEYISNFGHENLMQRSNNGNTSSFQSTMQSFMVIRGFIVALVLVWISPSIPVWFNIRSDVFNYGLLAIVPIINGFAHMDQKRLHRVHNFQISTRISLISDASSVIIALACANYINSYWAFYFSFIFKHSINTFLSHLWAIRPYRLSLNKTHLIAIWQFGLPLILIGVLKYFGTEVDKALIARYSGLEQFTIYFLTLMVVVNIANIISIGLAKIFIRRASMASPDNLLYVTKGNGIISLYLALPLLYIISIHGERLIALIFGQQYLLIPYLLPTLVTLVSLRVLSRWLTQIVIGASDNKLMLAADIVRIIALCVGITWCIYLSERLDVRLFSIVFLLCELIYFITLSILLTRTIPGIFFAGLKLLGIVTLSSSSLVALYSTINQLGFLIQLVCSVVSTALIIASFNYFSIVCRNQTNKLLIEINTHLSKK